MAYDRQSGRYIEDLSPNNYIEIAKALVRTYVEDCLDKMDEKPVYEVYVVWFSKTLLNWKAMVSTTLPDGMYYEVTHNGNTGETYLDAYKKIENVIIKDN